MKLFSSFLYLVLIITAKSQNIKYLNGLSQSEVCDFENGISGTCKKMIDCKEEFEKYRKNKSVLRVCSFGATHESTIICCPNSPQSLSTKAQKKDLTSFETCRDEFLRFRKNGTNINHYANGLSKGTIPKIWENCLKLIALNKEQIKVNFWDHVQHGCEMVNGTINLFAWAPYAGSIVQKGDRPNMAAIGWTQKTNAITYNCGGSIITERFIVTAAHCKFFEGKKADVVRIGDRYLLTEEDDDIAQQLSIQDFIAHPNYLSSYNYNDIAMIKTVESIIFNNFVVPSCIAELDAERRGTETAHTVAGYGQTEDGTPANILLELKVDLVPNEECSKIFSDDPRLPNGIIDSQLCVKSKIDHNKEKSTFYPDTCFGDSGSPLQYKTAYEVFPNDFNTTYLSTMYLSSNVIGIVSFGASCGLDIPSVYTKLSYYRDWMKSVVESE